MEPVGYVNVFVDNFIRIVQLHRNDRQVRQTLMHAIDDVLRPLDKDNNVYCCKLVSLKKLHKGDCSWGTIKMS